MNSAIRFDKFLKGRVALVTGASRGIGKAVAMALAQTGAHVALTARSADGLCKVRDIIHSEGGQAEILPVDLADDNALLALIPQVCERLGSLDVLVNNAGLGLYGPVETATNETWDQVMRVNARAPFILCREAIAPMRRAGGGSIVNIASVVGIKGYVEQAVYGASKHAMMGFSKVLAQEVQSEGIRVHTVCPGGVDTEMAGQSRPDLDRSILIQPEEIAEAVLFLLACRGNAVIDDVHIRRASGAPWF